MKKMGHQGSGRMQSIREFGGGRTAERLTRTLAQVRQLPHKLLDHRFLLAGPPPHLPPHRGLRPRDAPDQPAVLDVGRAAAVLLVADRGVRGRAARGHRLRAAQHRRQLDLVVAVVARLQGQPPRQGGPRCSGGSLQQTAGFVPTGHLPVIDRAVFRQRRACSVVVVAGVLSDPRVTWACAAFFFGLTSLSRSRISENPDSRHPVFLGLSGSRNRPRLPDVPGPSGSKRRCFYSRPFGLSGSKRGGFYSPPIRRPGVEIVGNRPGTPIPSASGRTPYSCLPSSFPTARRGIGGADDFGRHSKKRRKDGSMTQEGMRDMQGNLQGGAQRWVDTMQRLAEQIQKQQQVSQQMTAELMNTYVQLLNTQGSYLAELPQQQQQNLQQLTQQAMQQAQEQQRTLQQQAQGQQQNFQQLFQQTLDTFSQLFNVPASHAGESAQIAQESARIVHRAASEVPIEGYDEMNVEEIEARLEGLSEEEVGRVREYERRNRNRATLIEQIDRRAAGGATS